MAAYLSNILSMPTLIFTVLLAFVLLYWIIAIIGLTEVDAFDHIVFHDGSDIASGHVEGVGAAAGLLMKVGLNGIPVTIIFSIWVLMSFVCSYIGTHYMPAPKGWDIVNFITGFVIFSAALIAGFFVTVAVLRPIRKVIFKLFPDDGHPKVLVGLPGVVKSQVVNEKFGYGFFHDGGAGLQLNIRTANGELKSGDEVVLIENLTSQNAWRVVSKAEFEGH